VKYSKVWPNTINVRKNSLAFSNLFGESNLNSIVHRYEHMFTILNNQSMSELITPYSLRLLFLLAYNPLQSFYQRELSKKTKVSVGETNKILKKLVAHSIIAEEKRGKTHFYRFNMNNALARQIKIMITVSALNSLVEEIKEISTKIILFGSCAEGTDTVESDIDLFILTDEKGKVKAKLSKHGRSIERRISPIIVDASSLSTMKSKDKALYERIMSGIVLWQAE